MLMEHIEKRIQKESEGGKKYVCYLIVSHGAFVDDMAKILLDKNFDYEAFKNLSKAQR